MKRYKKGMTLVEVIVAIAIISFGMAAFTLLSAKVWNYKSFALEQATETASASKVVTRLVREIRTARQADDGSYAIKEAKENSLTMYRDEDGDGSAERVHYFLDGDKLKKGVTKYDMVNGLYEADDQEIETLLSYVTNTEKSSDLFVYYKNGYPIDPVEPMNSGLASDVQLVRIHLWVNVKPIVAPENINLEGLAELRNINEY